MSKDNLYVIVLYYYYSKRFKHVFGVVKYYHVYNSIE